MALGGGTFQTQNKVLPGTYQNFISAARAFSNLSSRGYVALPIILDWGPDAEVFTVTQEELQVNARKIFGYDYTDVKLKGIRDVFKNATTAFIYKLANAAVAATNTFATAKYKGVRGNDLKIVISANVDEPTKFDVQTYLGTALVDEQIAVATAADLVANDYVTFKSAATLVATAGTALTAGSNGDALTGAIHQEALDAFESYGFNTLACLSAETDVKSLYVEYTKRLRDQVGAKFQLVGYTLGTADHEGVIDVVTKATEADEGIVYWTVGAQSGVAVNASTLNKVYNGEYTPDLTNSKTQLQLNNLINTGKFAFHKVGSDIRVLDDINTFTSFTTDKSEDFASNQTIRVLDQIAIDTATIFNTRFLGKVPNDKSGRVSLWNELVKQRKELQTIRAIQEFKADELTIEQGNLKKSVVVNEVVEPIVAMSQLYITTTVS